MTPEHIIELSYGAQTSRETFDGLLDALRSHFDADVASLHLGAAYPVTACGPIATLGFDRKRLLSLAKRWRTYVEELEPLRAYAIARTCVVTEHDVLSESMLAKRAFYRELSQPEGGVQSLVAYLPWRGCATAAIMLGSRRRRHSDASRAALQALIPTLTLAVAAAPARGGPALVNAAELTARETEVLGYVEAGLTNAEVACCLGTSVNTVRNQVASLLTKLGLDSRVQLAGTGLGSYVVSHR